MATGKDTAKVCSGVKISVPIYPDVSSAIENHKATVLILLIPPTEENYPEIEKAIKAKLDIINTSFKFIKNDGNLMALAKSSGIRFLILGMLHTNKHILTLTS